MDLAGDVSLGGSFDYHEQQDNRIAGFGIGYDGKSGIGPIKAIYGEGEDILDVGFKPTSLAELQAAFSEGATERIKDNIRSTIGDIRNSFKAPAAEKHKQYEVESEHRNELPKEQEGALECKQPEVIKRDQQEKLQDTALPQPIILSSDIKEENITSYGEVPLGNALEAIEKHGLNRDFLNPVEILDINPAANLNNTDKCLVFLYDPSVVGKVNEDKTITYYIDGIGGIENAPSVGHFYAGLGKIENNSCIKQGIFGKNPAIEGKPIAKGVINEENRRYNNARGYEKQENTKVIMEVGVPVTEEKYQAVKNYIETQKAKPDKYVGHYQDCISFDNKILEIAGLEGVKVTDLIKTTDIKRFSLAKASAWLRSLDNKIVQGISAEDIAKDYGIATDRLVNIISAERDILTFKILPYTEYLQKKTRDIK